MRLAVERVRAVGTNILSARGVPKASADLQIDLLLAAEVRGHSSHGILRLERLVERLDGAVASPTATGRHQARGEALLVVDGQQGLGPVVAEHALAELMRRVEHTGVAAAAIHSASHLGMLAFYAERMARAGYALLAMSVSEALVHPWGGREALVGTNPIAIGVPAQPEPLIFDMATSNVSAGKIIDHANRDIPIPLGWAIDRDGNPTTSPHEARMGALSPFGGGKGYGLAIALEALLGLLAGAEFGTEVRGTLDSDHPSTKADLFVLFDARSLDGGLLNAYLNAVRESAPADAAAPVTVPGDRSRARAKIAEANGVDVPDELWRRLERMHELQPIET